MNTILVIGCGSIGERHIRCFQKTGAARVCACDANPELLRKVSKEYDITAYSDWEAAIKEPEIDAVLIATPAHLHVTMASAVLKADKHVFIEKPLSVSLEGVEELIQLRDTSGKQALVAYTYRSIPVSLALKKQLDASPFGPPLAVTVVAGQHFPTFRPAYRDIYYNDHAKGGGAIQDGLTHMINTVEWLVGPLDSVYCDAEHLALDGVTVEDTAYLLGRSGRILCNFSFNQFQAPNEISLTIHAKGGSICAEYHRNRCGTLALGDTDWNWHDIPPPERDTLYINQAQAFLNAMQGDPTQLSTLEEGLQTLRVNLAALQSAQSQQPRNIR